MIPIHKLRKLPRSQSLRKSIKIIEEAERQLAEQRFSSGHIDYLADAAAFLAEDDLFDDINRFALKKAAESISGKKGTELDKSKDLGMELSRSLNTIRHILLRETGKQTADWDFIDHKGRLNSEKRHIFSGINVFLEDIRSPFNVGAIFRTAESFGVDKILVSPLCADPHHQRAMRTAMGCIELVPWERCSLESVGSPVFVLETGGTELRNFSFPFRGTMIIGSEELGVSPEALSLADTSLGRVSIPTYGAKGSLNVSVAFGVAIQAWAASILHSSCTAGG
ncbi:TrmH family RNA methyltransferase [Treponema sp. OttesenSCG-928-L16]|nr:TrmH family RNA methyltransferase [Treponema sp. OttesenSCG-928-L16]